MMTTPAPAAAPAAAAPEAPASTTPAPESTPAASTTPETTPASSPAIAPDGSLGDGWHTTLGDEFAPHGETLSRFKNVGDLAKSFIHARNMKPAFPGADATPQDIETWRTLAGVPESPEGYGITKPEELPAGVEWNDDRVAKFTQLAHKHHVHPDFLKEAIALDMEINGGLVAQAQQQAQEAQQQAKTELMEQWGSKFEENASTVRHWADKLAASGEIPPEKVAGLANDPTFGRIILEVSKLVSEDSIRTPLGFGDVRSPQQQYDDIRNGKDEQWSERYKNGDPAAMEHVTNLIKKTQQS